MGQEPRELPRSEIACDGRVRTQSGLSGQATLYDVSLEGCSFHDRNRIISEGQKVKIWFSNVGPFAGTIRWWKDGIAGMEFDRPLYTPVFEHLRDSLKWDEATQGRRSSSRPKQ